ncbi:MAG TPA: hypothetical protein VIE88_02365 [Vicinamibacteria bacterium]|jgi:hypothetical protein
MGKISWFRVVLGGLVAGFVINVGEFILNEVILGRKWAAAMESLGRPPMGNEAITLFVVLGFLLGIGTVFLYVAIRPRYGAGPRTAVCAGVLVWFFAYLYTNVGMMAMGLLPKTLLVMATLWGLLQLPIATVFGAWLYKEEAP